MATYRRVTKINRPDLFSSSFLKKTETTKYIAVDVWLVEIHVDKLYCSEKKTAQKQVCQNKDKRYAPDDFCKYVLPIQAYNFQNLPFWNPTETLY
jgi:hypothetical protein